MCNNNNDESKCIAEILEVILILQRNATREEETLDTCDRGFLGCGITTLECNTRPVMLYGCNGTAWAMPISKDPNETCTSNVFRIEKLDENCATFRVLVANPDNMEACNQPYVATNSFFTMNLNCCCCLRCLNDTFIECI
jgi:Spore coat protein Z.